MADEAKEVTPVLMFDDRSRDQGRDVRDFRPISEHVEANRGKSDHLGGLSTDLDGHPDNADDPGVDDEDDPGEDVEPDEGDPTEELPVTEPDAPGNTADADADDGEGDDGPPAPSSEPEDEGSEDESDDIPSPWDDDTNA